MVKWMKNFFQYLDRYYVEMYQITNLRDQGLKIFKDTLFRPVSDNATLAIIEIIKCQRNGDEMIDETLLKNSVQIFLDLSSEKLARDGFVPRTALDKAVINQTREFYEYRSK